MTEQLKEFDNATGSACRRGHGVGKALGKGLSLASLISTSPATEPEVQHHLHALNWHVLQTPVMPAMTGRRLLPAVGAIPITLTRRRDQPANVNPLGAVDAFFRG